MNRSANRRGTVEHDRYINTLWNRCFKRRKLRPYPIDRVDDVGTWLPEDDERNRPLAVQITCGADVLHGIDNIGYIGEVHRRTVVVADNEWLVLFSVRDLPVDHNISADIAVCNLSASEVRVLQA